jgi:polysaccharide export outer membrane protein
VKAIWAFALTLTFGTTASQLLLKAQEPVGGASAGASAPAPSIDYLISPGDTLDIYVYDVPEISHSYIVSASGTVAIPLLPQPVQAAGLTSDQFARSLEEAFRQSGRLQRPQIAVSVKPSLNSSVAVEGPVKNPQIFFDVGRVRLIDVLTQCGGLTEEAGENVTITRGPLGLRNLAAGTGQATPTLTVELKKVMDVGDPASSIAVWPGDRVVLERKQPEVYYVLGEVRTPGGYTIKHGREELTFLRAIAMAGDMTNVAKRSKAYIIRKDPTAPKGRQEIQISLVAILNGKSPDPKVQAEDILFIPGSNSKKALHTLESAPGLMLAGAGATVYH